MHGREHTFSYVRNKGVIRVGVGMEDGFWRPAVDSESAMGDQHGHVRRRSAKDE